MKYNYINNFQREAKPLDGSMDKTEYPKVQPQQGEGEDAAAQWERLAHERDQAGIAMFNQIATLQQQISTLQEQVKEKEESIEVHAKLAIVNAINWAKDRVALCASANEAWHKLDNEMEEYLDNL